MKEEIVLPNYNNCILNTITSILKYYKVETNHNSLKSLDEKLNKQYQNVILLILDGMGEHILNNLSPNGYFIKNKIDCLTSVFPSTTTAALTTYYSGRPPYETGWIAWSQYFKEYGRALDMLAHRESYQGEILKKPSIDVFKTIVNYESVFDRIEKVNSNIKAFEITPTYSDKRSARSIRADNIDEAIEAISLISQIPGEKFMLAYCDNPDSLLHKCGATSEEAKLFITETEEKIKRLYETLPQDTILIITADHGHKNIEKTYTLLDYPEIQECLIQPASLESRCLSFWVKENMKDVFEKRFNKVFSEEFILMTKEEFLSKNFLGLGEKHPKIDDFIGNYVAISVASSIIRLETFLAEGKGPKKSTHCGLTKDEMEVPLIVIEK